MPTVDKHMGSSVAPPSLGTSRVDERELSREMVGKDLERGSRWKRWRSLCTPHGRCEPNAPAPAPSPPLPPSAGVSRVPQGERQRSPAVQAPVEALLGVPHGKVWVTITLCSSPPPSPFPPSVRKHNWTLQLPGCHTADAHVALGLILRVGGSASGSLASPNGRVLRCFSRARRHT